MMRILGILLVAVVCSSSVFAQFSEDDWIIGFQGSAYSTKYNQPFGIVTLDVTYFVHPRVSLNHTYAAGNGYFRAPASYAAAGLLAVSSGDPSSILFALLIPEGVTYYVPLTERSGFAPYINLVGLEYNTNAELRESDWNLNAALGAKFYHFIGEDWVVNASLEMRNAYTEPRAWTNINVGGGIGYRFEFDPDIF